MIPLCKYISIASFLFLNICFLESIYIKYNTLKESLEVHVSL